MNHINTKLTTEKLIEAFLLKGGRINSYYLKSWNKHKSPLVYLNGWHGGKTMRDAIIKALG